MHQVPKNFGLTDHQVDLTNNTMVKQYQRISCNRLLSCWWKRDGECFKASFGATESQVATWFTSFNPLFKIQS